MTTIEQAIPVARAAVDDTRQMLADHLASVRAEIATHRSQVEVALAAHLAAAKELAATMAASVTSHRTAMDGVLQPIGEGLDQMKREVQWALKRCEALSQQLENELARVEALAAKAGK
jgi:chromosome segregation ATPase